MDRLSRFVRENKIAMCLCWLIITCITYVFFSKIFYNVVTYLQLIWICCIGLVIYWAIVFTLIYLESNNKLKWISSISDQFIHMQIFLDNNTVIIELLEGELEKLEKLAMVRGFTVERISEYNDLTKVIIK